MTQRLCLLATRLSCVQIRNFGDKCDIGSLPDRCCNVTDEDRPSGMQVDLVQDSVRATASVDVALMFESDIPALTLSRSRSLHHVRISESQSTCCVIVLVMQCQCYVVCMSGRAACNV